MRPVPAFRIHNSVTVWANSPTKGSWMMRKTTPVVAALALAVAGSLVTAGSASARDSSIAFNGNDLSTWQANGVVWALAQAGGTVFAGGTFTAIRPPGVAAGGTGERA